jgi:hypothetical protein
LFRKELHQMAGLSFPVSPCASEPEIDLLVPKSGSSKFVVGSVGCWELVKWVERQPLVGETDQLEVSGGN